MSAAAVPESLLNPAGQPVSEVVAEAMVAYGIEQGELAFVETGTWIHAAETSATVALETTERATVTLTVETTDTRGETTGQPPCTRSPTSAAPVRPGGTPETQLLSGQPPRPWSATSAASARPDAKPQVRSSSTWQAAPHYLHIFHLTDLRPGTPYLVRATATGGNGQIASRPALDLRPQAQPTAIHLPGGAITTPLLLEEAGASYVLSGDLSAAGTAVRIAAPDITLDLDGHELVYNQQPADRDGDTLTELREGLAPATNSTQGTEAAAAPATTQAATTSRQGAKAPGAENWLPGAYGIELAPDLHGVTLRNGHLRQGDGGNAGGNSAVGFNACVALRPTGLTLEGITATYHGTQLSGIVCQDSGPGCHLHHNIITDAGRRINNRHRMCCAIRLHSTGGGHLHHNLVARTRQSALGSTGKRVHVHHNELHIDSHSINSFGIGVKDHSHVHDNRIFGCGDNAVGMATTGGCRHVDLHHNYIWLQAHSISAYLRHLNTKEMEAAPYSIMSGVRITWGCSHVCYRDNIILVTAREGGFVRGTFLYNDPGVHASSFRDNLVVALAEDEHSHGWGAIGGVGNETQGDVEPLVFRGNTIVSNFVCFNLQDTYGVAINYHLVDNTFVRFGTRPGFATLRARQVRPSRGHVLRDNRWLNGADLDQVQLGPEDAFEVQRTQTLTLTPGAAVSVSDGQGRVVFRGRADGDGKLRLALTVYRQTGAQRVYPGPYTVTVEGQDRERTLMLM